MSGSGVDLKIEQAETHNIIEHNNNITPFFFIGFLSIGLNRSDNVFIDPDLSSVKVTQVAGLIINGDKTRLTNTENEKGIP